MRPKISSHPWSEEALLAKTILYSERMQSMTTDEWQYPLLSAFILEFLARAALAHISPVLLADAANWRNVTYAIGRDPTAKKFNPVSVPTKEVLARLTELIPEFTQEIAGFCSKHIDRRNGELHSGELAFEKCGTAEWLPRFYSTCKVLLESMGKTLSALFADPEVAQAMIESLEDATAKAVNQDINAHAQVWKNKPEEEQKLTVEKATAWATRQTGHRADCPACQSPGLVHGKPTGPVTTRLDDVDEVVQKQTVTPSSFECIACGLKISGFSRLSACGLGDTFTEKTTVSAAEYFQLYTEDELEEARREVPFEPDFND